MVVSRPTSIEVCAGAGGQAIGLHRAGFMHKALVEIDSHAAETLRMNGERLKWWPSNAVFEESMVGWTPPSDVGPIDLVAGGVPCPPFSIAGRQLGHDDDRDMFPALLDLVEHVDPKVVMIENVRGLLGKRFDGYRHEILARLERSGYEGEWELLEAQDFGVPQLRPRSVLVAAKSSIWKFFKWPTPGLKPRVTVGEALGEMMAEAGWEGAAAWAAAADSVAPTLVGGSKKHGGPDLGPSRAKLHWDEVLGTNAKVLGNEPPQPGFVGAPKLTVQMAAVIQGFPTDWELSGKKTAQYRQVGNAFPPPVAEAVGKQIRLAIAQAQSVAL